MTSHGSLFDIMGPVMIGPSSSHTAGAVRLALLARNVANRPICQVDFTLYNSFAKTYKGHGTDRGLLAGILNIGIDDESIRDIFEKTKEIELKYSFIPNREPNHYPPNTVRFDMLLDNGESLMVTGHSIGGGKVYISKINDYDVFLNGEYPTLVMFYHDQPGMIWQTTKIIADENVNIASLNCSRKDKGNEASMVICLDNLISREKVEEIREIPEVYSVRSIDRIPSWHDCLRSKTS